MTLLSITCSPWHLQIRAALMRMSATLTEGGDPLRGGPASTQDLFRLLHASMVAQRLAEKAAQNLDMPMGATAEPGATEGESDWNEYNRRQILRVSMCHHGRSSL